MTCKSRHAFLIVLPVLVAAAPGTTFTKEGLASPDAAAVGRKALAYEMYGQDGTWLQTPLPVGSPALLVRVESGAFCGDVGCPTAVLVRTRGGWSTAWTGMASGIGTVLASEHHAARDIALGMRNGYLTLVYDGRKYVEAR